jgi:hypothetical protein
MLIAEDLILLAFHDETGKSSSGVSNLEYSLAGALLIELAMLGRIDVAGEEDEAKTGRLMVRDTSATGELVLDEALRRLEDLDGSKPKDALGPLARDELATRLLNGLAHRGILRKEKGRILDVFPTARWPAADSEHEAALRDGLHKVLVDGERPSERIAALIALLTAMDAVGKVLDISSGDPDEVKRRAKEIAEGNWVSDAMRKAVEEITAAVMVAVFVPTIMAASG